MTRAQSSMIDFRDVCSHGRYERCRNSHTATLLASGKCLSLVASPSVVRSLPPNYTTQPLDLYSYGYDGGARTSHTATLLANGKVLIAGGSNSAGLHWPQQNCTTRTGTNGTFAATGTMAAARTSHTEFFGERERAYNWRNSRYRPWVSLSSAEVYDVVAGSFSATDP